MLPGQGPTFSGQGPTLPGRGPKLPGQASMFLDQDPMLPGQAARTLVQMGRGAVSPAPPPPAVNNLIIPGDL